MQKKHKTISLQKTKISILILIIMLAISVPTGFVFAENKEEKDRLFEELQKIKNGMAFLLVLILTKFQQMKKVHWPDICCMKPLHKKIWTK